MSWAVFPYAAVTFFVFILEQRKERRKEEEIHVQIPNGYQDFRKLITRIASEEIKTV